MQQLTLVTKALLDCKHSKSIHHTLLVLPFDLLYNTMSSVTFNTGNMESVDQRAAKLPAIKL